MQTVIDFFSVNSFIPHGFCLSWNPILLWLHIISDTAIVLSYYSIPISILYFIRKRKEMPYAWFLVMAALFIVACGTTHLMSIILIWIPLYWLDGYLKAFTAIISVATAIAALWVIPFVLRLPSNAELQNANNDLAFQIAEKEKRVTELALALEQNILLSHQVNHLQKLESISRLTSGIAHDFNNILMCMLGYNEMNKMDSEDITNESLRASIENNTKQIDLAGKRAADLINKMLTYCRQNDDIKVTNIQATQWVIQEVLDMLRPALTNTIKVEFTNQFAVSREYCRTCDVLKTCSDQIQIDAMDLHQIVTNLAVNARDAMKERGGVITISLEKSTSMKVHCVACASMIEGDFIELCVADNGTGIDPKVLSRIFDPFFTTKPQGEGTGLGLSTISGMVHKANGHIWVESVLDQGTSFRLLFPLAVLG